MSDFLTHLAARSLAPPTLRPRTLSRFESETPAEAPEPAVEDAAWPSREALKPAVEGATSPSHTALPPREGSEMGAARETVVAREHTREVVVQRTSATRVVETMRNVVAPRAQANAAAEAKGGDGVTPSESSGPATAPRNVSSEVVRETRVELPRRELAVPEPARLRNRVNDAAVPRGNAGVSRESAAGVSAPEPVIHVSIGRVEVRATAPPAPQRGTRNPARMSIDDYVARKNAKGRR